MSLTRRGLYYLSFTLAAIITGGMGVYIKWTYFSFEDSISRGVVDLRSYSIAQKHSWLSRQGEIPRELYLQSYISLSKSEWVNVTSLQNLLPIEALEENTLLEINRVELKALGIEQKFWGNSDFYFYVVRAIHSVNELPPKSFNLGRIEDKLLVYGKSYTFILCPEHFEKSYLLVRTKSPISSSECFITDGAAF